MNNRFVFCIAAFAAMLLPGGLYASSIFNPLWNAQYGWSVGSIGIGFILACVTLSLGAVIGGYARDKGYRLNVGALGAVIWGLGNVLISLLVPSMGLAALLIGMSIGGIGIGMIYIAAVSGAIRWFPDHRGFGSGLVLSGFGFGALVYTSVVKSLPSFQDLTSASTLSQTQIDAGQTVTASATAQGELLQIYLYSGIAFAVLGVLLSLLMKDAPAELTSREDAKSESHPTQGLLLWGLLLLTTVTGIVVLQRGVPYMAELAGQPVSSIVPIFTLIGLANGLGRFAWGTLSDFIGRRFAIAAILIVQSLTLLMINEVHSIWAIAAAFATLLFCYGGGFGLMPSFYADIFGIKRFGVGYGLVLTAWSVASIAGPLYATAYFQISRTYEEMVEPLIIVSMIALMFPMLLEIKNDGSTFVIRRNEPAPPSRSRLTLSTSGESR